MHVLRILLCSLTSVLFHTIFGQVSEVSPFITVTDASDNETILVDCDYPVDADRCFILKANYAAINETTSYDVTGVPYQDLINGLMAITTVAVGGDDVWSTVQDLPFTFCFFNDNYENFVLGDNGVISFDTTVAGLESQFIKSQIPSGNLIGNAIFGVFHDMLNVTKDGCFDDPATPENECGEIKLYVLGTAPQRAFVISYEEMNHFACENVQSTSQIVLYETSNVIEVYVKEKPVNCEFEQAGDDPDVIVGIQNRKNALIGIQNAAKSDAYFPPARNNSEWSTTNEAWRFTPNGTPLTVVQWKDETGRIIETGDQITICPEATTTYRATVTYDVCLGDDLTLEDAIPITIDTSYPVATDVVASVCDAVVFGQEEVDLTVYESALIGTQTGLIVSYHTTLNDAKNNARPINSPDVYELTRTTTTIYARLQRGVSCFDVGTVVLTLTPVGIPAVPEIAVCDEANDATETLNLPDYDTVLLGTQSNMNISYHFTEADALANTNSETELIAIPGASVFVRFTLGVEEDCSNVVEVPVRLKTKPIVEDIPIELCDHIPIYDLTQHEADVSASNTIPIDFSYHIVRSWADANINPIEEDELDQYVHRMRATIYVRAQGPENCHDVFELQFTYKDGIPVTDDQQIQVTDVFDLTKSIQDMITDDTNIQIDYVECSTDPPVVIPDPSAYDLEGTEGEVCVIFTNLDTGCINDGVIDLTATGGGGTGGGGGFASCDVRNDGSETFILEDFVPDIISRITYNNPELVQVTFHPTEPQAIANTDAILTRTITANETIYIRLIAIFEGTELEFWTDAMILEFKPTTPFDELEDAICDVRSDNRETVDLTEYEMTILDGKTGTFTYFDDRDNEIDNPERYTFFGPSAEIKVLIKTPDGCENETKITLTFEDKIPAAPVRLDACDFDGDRLEIFDLNDALPDINADYVNFTATYYSTQNNADTATDAFADPTMYLSNRSSVRVYVRLEDAAGCYTTTSIDLRIIRAPSVAITTLEICDFFNDAIEENVTLNTFSNTIKGNAGGVTVTYFARDQDAIDDANAITVSDITPTTTLYARLVSGTSCVVRSPITFSFLQTPAVTNITATVCDNETDGVEIYDLTQHEDELVTDTTNRTFTYHTSEADAAANRRRITATTLYRIDNAPQTIYVRIQENSTGCYSIANLAVQFIQPTTVTNTKLTKCDVSADGSEIFDATTAISDMITNPEDFKITYYSRKDAASTADDTFEFDDPTTMDTTIASIVYVRFYAEDTGCYSVGEVFLELLKTPKLLRGSFEICDTDLDGQYTLDLTDINTQMISNTSDLKFSYFPSFVEANTDVNRIPNPDEYLVTTSPQRVYARVEGLNQCFSVSFVDINIRQKVEVLEVTQVLESCDDDRDELAVFDLTDFETLTTPEIGATFRYYATQEDANTEQNEIADPTRYQNIKPLEQNVYVRVSVVDKCDDVTSFQIKAIKFTPVYPKIRFCAGDTSTLDAGPGYVSYVWNTGATTQTISITEDGDYTISLEDAKGCKGTFTIETEKLPLPEVAPASLVKCDDDGVKDGLVAFDLTDANQELTVNATGVSTDFYRSQSDLDSAINEITTPTNYVNRSNPQTVFVKITNNETGCFDSTTLTLRGSFIEANDALLEICDLQGSEDGLGTFNLSEADIQVLGTSLGTINYYKTFQDAQLVQNVLANSYENTIPYNQIIFARIENTDQCFAISKVVLQVNKLPNISEEEALVYCQNFYPDTITLASGILPIATINYTYLWENGEATTTVDRNTAGVYTVVVTNTKGCSKTRKITVDSLTVEAFDAGIVQCDTDGVLDDRTAFDLTTTNMEVTGGNSALYVEFYATTQDAVLERNKLNASSYSNITNPQTVFAKVLHKETFCYEITEVALRVSAIQPNQATLEVCDMLGSEDGIAMFTLSDATAQVLAGLPVTEVQYFETYDDAANNRNALNNSYENTVPYTQEIYSRIGNADDCIGIASVTLVVNRLPDIQEEEELLYCENTYPATITVSGGILNDDPNAYTYLWNTGATSSTIQVNEMGIYVVTVTSDKGCSKDRMVMVISSEIATIERIEIEDQLQINTVTVFATGIGDYEYAINDSNYQDSNFFENIPPGLQTVYVRDKNGCGVVEESIAVVGFPNFFSPNGDGQNDVWSPVGFSSEFQEGMEIGIFDRYGKLLTKINPESAGWDGTFNGTRLPATDYWYKAQYKELFSGKIREAQGHFSLLR